MNTSAQNRRRRADYRRPEGPPQGSQYDRDIYHRHYEREDDDYYDPRRSYDSGRPNHPNYGREVYGQGPDIRRGYGYNQGRNSASNIGGRAYGQSYGQYFQGSDSRRHSNPRDYEGHYDPYYGDSGRGGYYEEDRDMRRWDDYYDDRYDIDHEYREYGFQGSGNKEGFGQRAGHRNERDWYGDDTEYRGGHAQRHRGVGKYGSR